MKTKRVYDIGDSVMFNWRHKVSRGTITEIVMDPTTSGTNVFAYTLIGTLSGDEYFILASQILGLDSLSPDDDPADDYDRAMGIL